MISKRKTTVSALRQFLGISLEDFAVVIDKSLSTVASLESGRLKLSQSTALEIAKATGVALEWLLSDKPKSEPYSVDAKGNRTPYSKDVYERTQAAIAEDMDWCEDPEDALSSGIVVILEWLSIHLKAISEKREQLACYLMRQFLSELVERLGKDDDAFIRVNNDSYLVDQKGVWKFEAYENEEGKNDLAMAILGPRGRPPEVDQKAMKKAQQEMFREVREIRKKNPSKPAKS